MFVKGRDDMFITLLTSEEYQRQLDISVDNGKTAFIKEKNFIGGDEIIKFVAELSTLTIPLITIIIKSHIESKKETTIKIGENEIKGIVNRKIICDFFDTIKSENQEERKLLTELLQSVTDNDNDK